VGVSFGVFAIPSHPIPPTWRTPYPLALTDNAIRKAQPGDKPRKLADERGLYLLLNPSGSRLWRLKYRHEGKEKLLALGGYPDVSLADARERREAARKLIAAGIDPSASRKAEKAAGVERAANSFEIVAREWFEKYRPTWSTSHARIIARLERDVFPRIGRLPVASITPPFRSGCRAPDRDPRRPGDGTPGAGQHRPGHAVCHRDRSRRARTCVAP
jgi:hypothetical protein